LRKTIEKERYEMNISKKEFTTSLTQQLSEKEIQIRADFLDFFLNRQPVVSSELMENLGLYIHRRELGRILYMHELYQKIVGVEGVIMEFGCRWGQNLVLFENFRGLYEPYKVGRKIIGFDTFEGFPEPQSEDGSSPHIKKGAYDMPQGYEKILDYILHYHEQESPISHVKKYEVVKGDVSETLISYLDDHPETIIAMAYFDLDLYKPTKDCINAILPHMPKGSILGFDELNYFGFPGETLAVRDTLGIQNLQLRYSPLEPSCSYAVL